MAKIIRLTENDLKKIIKRVLTEGKYAEVPMKVFKPIKKLGIHWLEKGYTDNQGVVHLYFADCTMEFIKHCDDVLTPIPKPFTYVQSENCRQVPEVNKKPKLLSTESEMWVKKNFCITGGQEPGGQEPIRHRM